MVMRRARTGWSIFIGVTPALPAGQGEIRATSTASAYPGVTATGIARSESQREKQVTSTHPHSKFYTAGERRIVERTRKLENSSTPNQQCLARALLTVDDTDSAQ